jgi:hypothetical protein
VGLAILRGVVSAAVHVLSADIRTPRQVLHMLEAVVGSAKDHDVACEPTGSAVPAMVS